jgi:hypothetical protein
LNCLQGKHPLNEAVALCLSVRSTSKTGVVRLMPELAKQPASTISRNWQITRFSVRAEPSKLVTSRCAWLAGRLNDGFGVMRGR